MSTIRRHRYLISQCATLPIMYIHQTSRGTVVHVDAGGTFVALDIIESAVKKEGENAVGEELENYSSDILMRGRLWLNAH